MTFYSRCKLQGVRRAAAHFRRDGWSLEDTLWLLRWSEVRPVRCGDDFAWRPE